MLCDRSKDTALHYLAKRSDEFKTIVHRAELLPSLLSWIYGEDPSVCPSSPLLLFPTQQVSYHVRFFKQIQHTSVLVT